jgi:hypothetical protein
VLDLALELAKLRLVVGGVEASHHAEAAVDALALHEFPQVGQRLPALGQDVLGLLLPVAARQRVQRGLDAGGDLAAIA